MTRLSGIQLLALSFVLWALAVWIFGAPQPAETETTATAETSAQTPGEETEEPGTSASESDGTDPAAVLLSRAPANQEVSPSPAPDPGSGGSLSQAASERPDMEIAAPPPSHSGAPAIPSAGTRAPPAAPGNDSRVALAPGPAGGNWAADATLPPHATGTGPVAGRPIAPGESAPRSTWGSAGGPPAPAASPPWFEHPLSRPPLPPRSNFPPVDGDIVSGQINAARRAAWEGRLTDALAHYRAAARLRPNDYMVWGEMGNVLWTMQRWPEAAYALEGAATLLVRAGELRAASELVPAVGRVDPDAAYRVQRLLWAAAQR